VRFDESDRLKELITQVKTSREQSVTGSGHVLAMQTASANMNPLAKLSHELMGLGAIKNIKALEKELKQGNYEPLKENLEKLHASILDAPKQWLAVAEKEAMDDYLEIIKQTWADTLSQQNNSIFVPEPHVYKPLNQAWIANSQVHFCAKAYPTVAMEHADAAALSVLGGVLRNGYLHRTIREQGGAYGGGASQDSNSASFRFYSYRDPRMSETLKDFDNSIAWIFDKTISDQSIEESILGIISSLDKPGSPAGEAKQEFHAQLTGRTCEKRSLYREQVTQVTADDLRRVAETYLQQDKASTVVVTGNHGEKEANTLGLDIVNL
jgi:hypothetical protein